MIFIFFIPEFLLVLPIICMLLSAIAAAGSIWTILGLFYGYILEYFWLLLLFYVAKTVLEIYLRKRYLQKKNFEKHVIVMNALQYIALLGFSYKTLLIQQDHPIIMILSSLSVMFVFCFQIYFQMIDSIFAEKNQSNMSMIFHSVLSAIILLSCLFTPGWMLVTQALVFIVFGFYIQQS